MKTVNDIAEPKRSQIINLFKKGLDVDVSDLEIKDFKTFCDGIILINKDEQLDASLRDVISAL